MSKTLMAVLGVFGICAAIVVVLGVMFVSTMNTEARLRNTINAKQKDNTSEFDNMWKKVQQVAQCTDSQMAKLKDIYTAHASARTGNGGGGGLMKMVQESIPNIDVKTYENLQNIIVASRDSWTQRQKELVDLKREHDNLLSVFPSSLICSILGRQQIDITIVTSSKTARSFETGQDNDTNLFNKE